MGAAFTLRIEDGVCTTCVLLPGGDGTSVDVQTVVSASSPIAAAVMSLDEGELSEVVRKGDTVEVEVATVR